MKPRMFATRLFLISAANIGPNRFHQNRTVSWLMSNPALGQQTLDVAQGQRVSHIQHHHQPDDLRRAVKISERVSGFSSHGAITARGTVGISSDNAPATVHGEV